MLWFHKRRIFATLAFCSGYGLFCKKMVNHPSESMRLGVAGSVAMMIMEVAFHVVDTVNIRSKVAEKKVAN